ncbi:MAG: YceI family protein, partial [Thermomicrobiales bacterium]
MKRNVIVARIVGALIAAIALVIGGAYILFPLAAQGKLPGQAHPTAIPVTPFANVSPTVQPSVAIAAVTGTTAPVTSDAVATPASPTVAATTVPSGASAYTIVGDQSQAKVTVNEKLAFLPSNSDAVLTTNAMQGQIVLGADGMPTNASKIQVDLRTLKSDQTMRDNYIRQTTLQSDTYPIAEFVISGVAGGH